MMQQPDQRYQLQSQIFDVIEIVEDLAVVPNPSVETDSAIVLVQDVVLHDLIVFAIGNEGCVVAGNSDARVA
mgnify:FL=1